MKLESISFHSKLSSYISIVLYYYSVLVLTIAVASFNHGRTDLNSLDLRNLLISGFRDQVRNRKITRVLIPTVDTLFCFQMSQVNMGGYRTFGAQKREHSNSNTRSVIPYPRIGKRSGELSMY